MSLRLTPVRRTDLVKRLRKLGWKIERQGGRQHTFVVKDDVAVRIPNEHHTDIEAYHLQPILRETGITRKEWHNSK